MCLLTSKLHHWTAAWKADMKIQDSASGRVLHYSPLQLVASETSDFKQQLLLIIGEQKSIHTFGAWKRGKEENVPWLHCIFKQVVINTSSRSAREIPHSGSGHISQEFGKDWGLLLISYSHSQAATIVFKSCSFLLTSAFLKKAQSLKVSQWQRLIEFIHKTGISFRCFHSKNSSYIQLPAELCLLLLSDYSSPTFFS